MFAADSEPLNSVAWQDELFRERPGENIDVQNVNRVRQALKDVKTAYYPGAGGDTLLTALCPAGSTIVMQALDYNPRHHFFREKDMQTYIGATPLRLAGLEHIPNAEDFDPNNPVVDLHLASNMTVKIVGDGNDEVRNVPESIDMIYAPEMTPTLSPVAYDRLSVNGLVVTESKPGAETDITGRILGIPFDDLPSFEKREDIVVEKLPPELRNIATYTDNDNLVFSIYEKVSELTPLEKAIFEVESAVYYAGAWKEWYESTWEESKKRPDDTRFRDYANFNMINYHASLERMNDMLRKLESYRAEDPENIDNYDAASETLQEYMDEYKELVLDE